MSDITTPVAPKLEPAALPPVDDVNAPPPPLAVPVTEATELSQLTTAQVYELNQSLLDEASDVERPLIDQLLPISALRAEYENGNPAFTKQIDWLTEKGYQYIRRTRGDGDCFYRSLAFAYVEQIMSSIQPDDSAQKALTVLRDTKPMLEQAGFQEIVYQDFYEELESLLLRVLRPNEITHQRLDTVTLLQSFQTPEVSNSIVVYLRLLTSAQVRADPDAFAPFLFHPEIGEPLEVREFCEAFIEAVGKEADHVQMTALSRALGLNVDVAYLDGRDSSGQVDFVQFRNPEGSTLTPITLLYRPGHYDILLNMG
ncbi:cysteine proteinase [Cylindrobasidium torrendii FP15055 ss-10]|uniref:ubiquitinyl hydrolase 1 n=1 Tax=Cylindrobasidium torrendii FP15055 ss-10 TaxID=1314674 RepID=A0A0D7BNF9_9AGAR|nr:cysteine proteinase [Cylindrobasidium torrendii FP15055 ss-10]